MESPKYLWNFSWNPKNKNIIVIVESGRGVNEQFYKQPIIKKLNEKDNKFHFISQCSIFPCVLLFRLTLASAKRREEEDDDDEKSRILNASFHCIQTHYSGVFIDVMLCYVMSLLLVFHYCNDFGQKFDSFCHDHI